MLQHLHWSSYILLIPLTIAVYTDVKSHKIYNWLTFPTLFVGLIMSFFNGIGIVDSLLGFVGAFAISLFLYITKGIYGGDVKLIAAIGAWIGKAMVIKTFIWIFICGGLLSILFTLKNGTFGPTMSKIGRFFLAIIIPGMKPQKELEETINEYVPYGIAISSGTIISVLFPNSLF